MIIRRGAPKETDGSAIRPYHEDMPRGQDADTSLLLDHEAWIERGSLVTRP
jgi:hypothetical protein